MPRLARLDAPGVLHHIILRGIKRRKPPEEHSPRQCALKRRGYDAKKVAERVAEIYGTKVGEILARGRQQRRVGPRSLFCFWAVRELGNSLASLASRLEMSLAGVGYAVQRGEAIAQEKGYKIIP